MVGGGKVAEQKINGLIEANADVTVIAPTISAMIAGLAAAGKIKLHVRGYKPGDVQGFFIVISAADDGSVQERVFKDAQERKVPVNVVDKPELCNFHLSSVFQKGDLKIAVSTNGKSPTLGKIIRDKIAEEFFDDYPELLKALGEMRPDVQKTFPDFESRKKLHEQIVRTELDRLQSNAEEGNEIDEDSVTQGKVYLVGAGPGDPELITVKGQRLLRTAEVVLYDALISTDLLSLVPESAEKFYVGKRADAHCVKQEEINRLLIKRAQEGMRVIRLKGGDPFIFGRGGEELEALQESGIEVEVVPGITAGIGVPTSLGIPLTYRKESSSIAFVTGHEDPTKHEEQVDWDSVSHADTIVVYMGIKRLRFIVEHLISCGVSPMKPVVVIFGGTLAQEIVVAGTLEDIEDRVRDNQSDLPGLIIIGDVVQFPDRITAAKKKLQLLESGFVESFR